jgi:hypothetical protein
MVVVRRDGDRERATFAAEFAEGVSAEFQYVVPELHSVHPEAGTSSGGTPVILSGVFFNISNASLIAVRLAGQECVLR